MTLAILRQADGGARAAAIAGADGVSEGGDAVAQRLAAPHAAGPGGGAGGLRGSTGGDAPPVTAALPAAWLARRLPAALRSGLMAAEPAAVTTPEAPPLR